MEHTLFRAGKPSYLATKTVNKNDYYQYQEAIFGTNEYIKQNKYFNVLKLIPNQ